MLSNILLNISLAEPLGFVAENFSTAGYSIQCISYISLFLCLCNKNPNHVFFILSVSSLTLLNSYCLYYNEGKADIISEWGNP